MAFNKKYAGLPDLDLAPDIYETPDLTDEASTLPTATIRTVSNVDDLGSDSDIEREHVNADEARAHFLGATVDARHVNFSDSIAGKRKSYKSKSRRRQMLDLSENEDASDSENESLERKLARLQREVEELKDEMDASKNPDVESNGAPGEAKGTLDDGVEKLSRALDNLYASSRGVSQTHSAAALVSQKLASNPPTQVFEASGAQSKATASNTEVETAGSVSSGILSHAAAFDARLALIESAMGISTSSNPFIPDGSADPPLQPVLPALDHLTSRLSTLMTLLVGPNPVHTAPTTSASTTTTVTTPHLEMLSTRVKKLTADAEALASARKRASDSAKVAQSARIARTASISSTSPPGADPEQTAAQRDEQATKIQALYATLPTIQSLHPILPSVLERLRSLRAIHAGAAQASESLDELEKRQAEMAGEIEQWREGLKNVEEKMNQGEVALKGNIDLVEPWVRDLEKRLERLELDR
ncbi:Dynamitin-domain-containing protein [Aspergillus cavernicola]|uniref:Dynamitin-domain-containing protein n=1 Tax=Aspergillus cavernicola TaxID=176166 RepID=A0ABR4HXS6_9EURO